MAGDFRFPADDQRFELADVGLGLGDLGDGGVQIALGDFDQLFDCRTSAVSISTWAVLT